MNNVLNIKAGAAGLKNTIRWIYFADCLQCVKNEYRVEDYIHGGELVVLTNPDVTEDKNKLMALITSMVDYSYERLKSELYHPYYMYRQSKSLGNLENVGWAQDGKECLYNVFMMDETHSVFAVGAGAVARGIRTRIAIHPVW